jgi:hypothetical protein
MLLITLSTLLATFSLASATISFTEPVASSSIAAGKPFKLTWTDDKTVPTLATFGTATFSLGIGGTVSQVLLQTLGTVNVATESSFSITIDATVGPSQSGIYFIRADSTAIDPTSAFGDPYEAFSAKFTLTGATGTFNATETAIAAGGAANATTPANATNATIAALPVPVTATSAPRSTITSTVPIVSTGFPKTSTNGTQSGAGILVPSLRQWWGLGGLVVLGGLAY